MNARIVSAFSSLSIGAILLALSPTATLALVINSALTRGDQTVQGQTLRSRGYYPISSCLTQDLPCVTATTNRFRPEATAQAKTIRELSRQTGTTFSAPIADNVQWEVAPSPDSVYAYDNIADPPDPQDLPDPDVHWRVDIMMNNSTILEVRDWRSSAHVPQDVRSRLINYQQQAKTLQITFFRDTTLNAKMWSRSYLDTSVPPKVWCVWADPDPAAFPGNIYFAPQPATPTDVQLRTPGCRGESNPQPVIDTAERDRAAAEATQRPVVEPQPVPNYFDPTQWQVIAPLDPARVTTLQLCYGDGACDRKALPQATGSTIEPFQHSFSCCGAPIYGTYQQAATIIETGLSTSSFTDVNITPGPGKSISIFDPPGGTLHTTYPGGGPSTTTAGAQSGDLPVSANYACPSVAPQDATFHPADGTWTIQAPGNGGPSTTLWGQSGDIPVPADYDGVGCAQIAVFRPSTGAWLIRHVNGNSVAITWGQPGDIPVPGDYVGAGNALMAVYRPGTGVWYVRFSDGSSYQQPWGGVSGDLPVPGDYDGLGHLELAIFRPSTGAWLVRRGSGANSMTTWGQSGDVPVPGDYNGDGKTDLAIYRPSTSVWQVLLSGAAGASTATTWGQPGDIPVIPPMPPVRPPPPPPPPPSGGGVGVQRLGPVNGSGTLSSASRASMDGWPRVGGPCVAPVVLGWAQV